MNFTLSDLVPPLRWNDPALLAELAREPSVPAGWWRSLPLGHVMAALGPERVCDLLAHMTQNQWPAAALGDVLPPLHVVAPAVDDWPTVAGVAMRRAGSWAAILALTAKDLHEMPGVGREQAFAVIHTVYWEVIGRLPATGAEPLMPDLAPPVNVISEWLPPSAPAGVRAALNQLALVTGGSPVTSTPGTSTPGKSTPGKSSPGKSSPERSEEPERHEEAGPATDPHDRDDDRGVDTGRLPAHRLPSATRATTTAGVRDEHELIRLINGAFADLDDLEWAIAQHRLFSDHPTDPRQLAKLFAVARERVMEAEEALRDRVAGWARTPEAAPLAAHLADMTTRLGPVAPVSRLANAAGWHQEELQALGVPVWRFLLPLLPEHGVAGDWLVSGEPNELFARTRELMAGEPFLEDARGMVAGLGVRVEDARKWLEATPGLAVRGGRVVADPGYVTEAEATGDEPRLPVEPQRHEFAGIRRLIANDIEEQGGEVLLDDLADRLSRRFGLSAPLVERYARGGEFNYDDGFVRLATRSTRNTGTTPHAPNAPNTPGTPDAGNGVAAGYPPDPAVPRDVSLTHRCFQGKRGGRWWYRVDVTEDLLGGGWVDLPAGFAAYLGIEPGDTRTGRSPGGTIEITWLDRPLMRPVQPLLRMLGAAPGDHVFLTLTSGGELIYRHLRAPEDTISGVGRAVRLAGYTAPAETDEDAVRLIAARIDLPESPDRAELIARLRRRGDHDILGALG